MTSELKCMIFIALVTQSIMIYFSILEDRQLSYKRHCGKMPETMNPPEETMGENDSVGIWPWHVSILLKPNASLPFSQICDGAIIHKYWIMTAAACVKKKQKTLLIRAGGHNLDADDKTTQQSEVAKIVIHRKFNPVTLRYNIALLKVKTHFRLNEFVYPICVPDKAATEHKHVICYITGYNVQPGDDFGVLQEARVFGLRRSACNLPDIWNYTVPVDMVCAGSFTAGGKACKDVYHTMQKNLGGALMCYIINEQHFYIIGIRVKVAACGAVERPDIYLDVSYHYWWIQNKLMNDRQ